MTKKSYTWEFYKDKAGLYRWRKISLANGKIVGASSESFASLQMAKNNARIMGYKG